MSSQLGLSLTYSLSFKKSLTYSDLDHIKLGQNWLFQIGYQNYDSNPIFMMSGHDMACFIFTQENIWERVREREREIIMYCTRLKYTEVEWIWLSGLNRVKLIEWIKLMINSLKRVKQ